MLVAAVEAVRLLTQYERMRAVRPDLAFDGGVAVTAPERSLKSAAHTLQSAQTHIRNALLRSRYLIDPSALGQQMTELRELLRLRISAFDEAFTAIATPVFSKGPRDSQCEFSRKRCRRLVRVQLDSGAFHVHLAYANALQLVQFIGSLPDRIRCIATLPNPEFAQTALISHTTECIQKLCAMFGLNPFAEVHMRARACQKP
jgi:hypothetical protein